MIKTSVRGAVTGVSARGEGECISGWDRLRDRRGDSKGCEDVVAWPKL